MPIKEAQVEVEKLFPWNIKKPTNDEMEVKNKKDEDYINRRDLEEIAYNAFGKPIETIPAEDLWLLEKHIPPVLQETWDAYEPPVTNQE